MKTEAYDFSWLTLRARYSLIRNAESIHLDPFVLDELKRNVRKATHKHEPNLNLSMVSIDHFYMDTRAKDVAVVNDAGLDGYTVKLTLPDSVSSMKEAEDWFRRYEYIEFPDVDFDCSGLSYTAYYRIFKVRDQFVAYHTVRFDN